MNFDLDQRNPQPAHARSALVSTISEKPIFPGINVLGHRIANPDQ
jgi:hypothetical protein